MKRIQKNELVLLSHNFQVRFALFCSYQVKKQWKNAPECVEAIRVTELWLEGKASDQECKATAFDAAAVCVNAGPTYAAYACVTYTAHAAGSYAAANAASAASYAASASIDASYAAANASAYAANATGYSDRVIEEQWDYYSELLHFDEIAEKTLLGVKA